MSTHDVYMLSSSSYAAASRGRPSRYHRPDAERYRRERQYDVVVYPETPSSSRQDTQAGPVFSAHIREHTRKRRRYRPRESLKALGASLPNERIELTVTNNGYTMRHNYWPVSVPHSPPALAAELGNPRPHRRRSVRKELRSAMAQADWMTAESGMRSYGLRCRRPGCAAVLADKPALIRHLHIHDVADRVDMESRPFSPLDSDILQSTTRERSVSEILAALEKVSRQRASLYLKDAKQGLEMARSQPVTGFWFLH
ncbi:hypothetical protein OE88DRAFT_1646182 [Heliocybe sulcata]|uniref:C2H2-type domain-containing protein n=1 Tax=Heliocybe sulcata TaxID=5364 RepID=A0A5C3MXL6_9AGAM|nr:hypothetical protein OE88DRAFT_1646182 [Heliocybe sulcata]